MLWAYHYYQWFSFIVVVVVVVVIVIIIIIIIILVLILAVTNKKLRSCWFLGRKHPDTPRGWTVQEAVSTRKVLGSWKDRDRCGGFLLGLSSPLNV